MPLFIAPMVNLEDRGFLQLSHSNHSL